VIRISRLHSLAENFEITETVATGAITATYATGATTTNTAICEWFFRQLQE